MVGRAAIDNNVGNPSLRRNEGKGSGRVDRQGRAQRHRKIGFHRRLARALEFFRIKILAEADCGWFQESATLTDWRPAIKPKVFEMGLWIAPPVTRLTFDQRIRPVKFYEAFRAGAGKPVQTVDILSDNRKEFPCLFQPDDGVMNRVGPGVAEGISPFELIIPMLDSRRFRRHEVLEIDGLPAGPDTLRATEIRNAAAR